MKEKGLNLKEYLKKHELTIHETGNYKAIAIPKVINSVFNHTGGDAIHDYRSRIRSYIRQRFDGKKIRFYKCQNLKTSVSIFGDLKKFELRKIIKNTDTK